MRQALGFAAPATPAVPVLPAVPVSPVVPASSRPNPLVWPDGLPRQIVTVQDASLDIYRQHGLPTEAGNYCAKGPDAPWEKLADGLTPAQKWALFQTAPEGAGWRFGTRASLGRHSPHEEVRRASSLLQTCEALQHKLQSDDAITTDDIAHALRIGTASGLWLQAQVPQPDGQTHTPLMFTAVADKS